MIIYRAVQAFFLALSVSILFMIVSACQTPDIHIPWPGTTTTTIPAVDMPQCDIIAGGEDFRGAAVDRTITAQSDRNGTTINYDSIGWPTHDGQCNGFVCIVYRLNDGLIKGGKVDWLPEHQTSYHWGFKHLADGYKGHETPPDGAECWVFILSIDRQHRSNGVRFVW